MNGKETAKDPLAKAGFRVYCDLSYHRRGVFVIRISWFPG